MFLLRYAALAALVVWLGGMVVLGVVVAPTTFRVLEISEPAAGSLLAATLFGEILRLFHLVAYTCGGVILVSMILMKLFGPPPRRFPARALLVAGMLAVALYSGFAVSGEIARLQAQVSGPIKALPRTDARRMRFDRLHGTSTALMALNLIAGLVLLSWYARE